MIIMVHGTNKSYLLLGGHMKNSDFKVGQIVFGKPGINRSRYSKEIAEGTIEKIGNKYIDVKFGRTYKYYKDTLRPKTEYAEDYYLYLDKQQILDEEEIATLISDIKIKFNSWGNVRLTLDQLRRIKAIIDED